MQSDEFQSSFPLGSKYLTPAQVNLGKVEQQLKRYPLDEETRNSLKDEVANYQNLDTLNAELLAGALYLMTITGGQITPDVLAAKMNDVLFRIPGATDSYVVTLRYQEALLRYLELIAINRSEQ